MTIRRRGAPVLHITGAVAAPRTLDRSGVEKLGDLIDVSGMGFDGWGVPVRGLLEDARTEATHASVESEDGHYRASIPLSDLGRGVLVIESNGEPLSRDSGGPFRLIVPEGRTLCWNVKGVAEIRFTAGPEPDSVPANPSH